MSSSWALPWGGNFYLTHSSIKAPTERPIPIWKYLWSAHAISSGFHWPELGLAACHGCSGTSMKIFVSQRAESSCIDNSHI